jgi:hypothetical protein
MTFSRSSIRISPNKGDRMDPQTCIAELRRLRVQKPFVPFSIFTTDGKEYTIALAIRFAVNDRFFVGFPMQSRHSETIHFDKIDRIVEVGSPWQQMEGDYIC